MIYLAMAVQTVFIIGLWAAFDIDTKLIRLLRKIEYKIKDRKTRNAIDEMTRLTKSEWKLEGTDWVERDKQPDDAIITPKKKPKAMTAPIKRKPRAKK